MIKREKATKLLDDIEDTLRKEFEQIRKQHYNPNTKGYAYEKILKDFLDTYLGGVYDFHLRAPVIDLKLEYSSVFQRGKNEFDIVATYKTTIPRIVLKIQKTNFIPYDAVAFIIEVKQTLDKASLKKDLNKFRKLSTLELGERFGVTLRSDTALDRPLRILFYYESKLSEERIMEILKKQNVWDCTVVFKNSLTIVNGTLPIIVKWTGVRDLDLIEPRYPLLRLMLFIAACLPYPILVDARSLFLNLIESAAPSDSLANS